MPPVGVEPTLGPFKGSRGAGCVGPLSCADGTAGAAAGRTSARIRHWRADGPHSSPVPSSWPPCSSRRRGQGWRLRHRVSDAEGALAAARHGVDDHRPRGRRSLRRILAWTSDHGAEVDEELHGHPTEVRAFRTGPAVGGKSVRPAEAGAPPQSGRSAVRPRPWPPSLIRIRAGQGFLCDPASKGSLPPDDR